MSLSMSGKATLREMFAQQHGANNARMPFDVSLLLLSVALMSIGLIIVTSASMPVGEKHFGNPFHYGIRHGIYMLMAIVGAMVVMQIPMHWWRVTNPYMLILAIGLLIAVLVFGRTVNGSTRWLALGPISVQAAEPAKLFFFCYLAGYLVRRYEEVTENLKGFIKPLIVFFAFAVLLLMQPDFGTVVVMFVTTIGLLFLAGAKLWQFFGLMFTGLLAIILLILAESYRMTRVVSFLDPWDDPYGTDYQLTHSLMSFGRGGFDGQGVGNSLQKLYLPEAHTDFIASIIGEELGFIGVLTVLLLLFAMVFKALKLGNQALQKDRPFEAYLAYAIGIWFSFQTAVNVGASAGVLPTKGLTLPLVSYGGSSLIIMAMAVGILLRIDFEMRVEGVQAISKASKKKNQSGKRKVAEVIDGIVQKKRGAQDA